jgi:hypothetical protein
MRKTTVYPSWFTRGDFSFSILYSLSPSLFVTLFQNSSPSLSLSLARNHPRSAFHFCCFSFSFEVLLLSSTSKFWAFWGSKWDVMSGWFSQWRCEMGVCPKSLVTVSPMASIWLYCKYFDDNKLYLVALMYLLQVW